VIPAPNHNRCLAFLIEMALREGDVPAAEQVAEALEMDVDAHPFYRYNGLAKERLLIAQNKKSEAVERLREKIKIADRAHWGYGGIAARILESTALEDQEASLEIFAAALTRSEPEGYLRIFVNHGQDIVSNLLSAAQRGLHPAYVERILDCIRQGEVLETAVMNQVEQLSERELEVLRLIAVGLSNREIAEQLYLSPGTIKTHVHNICGKLGVSNRTQAVVHARDLKLI
jgi:LuxR family maltose regulon positive regulatory protein